MNCNIKFQLFHNIVILLKSMGQFFKTSVKFLSLTAGIYLCYLISAIYHEKLLKRPYTHKDTSEEAYFSESFLFTIFPPLAATIIGQIILAFTSQNVGLPWKRCAVIASIINVNMFTYNQAVVYASFPAVVMAKSCSLLSVILVGVFFSRVKDSKLKLTHDNLIIGLVATVGIVLFNLFKQNQHSTVDKPISLFSLSNLFLIISLIGDGFLPDFQAQLKADFKPSSIQMYCIINRWTFLISLVLSMFSGSIEIIIDFLLNYNQFALDVLKLSLLNAIGQLFIYSMVKQFRQHIPAFVIAFRKCLTVIVNIIWFHHSINPQQIASILLVFTAVIWEVYNNYKKGQKKQIANSFAQIRQVDPDSEQMLPSLTEDIKVQTKA